jgi:starch synthase
VRHGIDPARPYAVFVGRVTRQKGIVHLLRAFRYVDAGLSLVLCAGESDTPEIGAEFRALSAEIARERGGVVVVEGMLSRPEVVQILSRARVFVCPSVYEPFGIVNLEAMACGAPVVASAVGGIPEIVVEGETGSLVRFEGDGTAKNEPRDPEAFARELARAIDQVARDPERARQQGEAGRRRVIEHFSWNAIAERTAALYESLPKK